MFDTLFENPLHLMLLLVVVLIVFGAGRLPEVGGALGRGIREFRQSMREESEGPSEAQSQMSPPSSPATGQPSTTSMGSESQQPAPMSRH